MVRRLKHEERLRELEFSCLEKAPQTPPASIGYLEGAYKQEEERLFTQSDRDQRRGGVL